MGLVHDLHPKSLSHDGGPPSDKFVACGLRGDWSGLDSVHWV